MEMFEGTTNNYDSIEIELASPEEIRSWSYGEVRKPETINYRTFRPEKGGLFCEKIFGPERDYECFCGRYKGIKYKGIVCDRCGVEITQSRVRRKRMGHINLVAPVVHIWFFKTLPSRLGTILEMKNSDLERIIYYQDIIVTKVKSPDCPLVPKDIISEEQYRDYKEKFRDKFEADTGASALQTLLSNVNLKETSENLRQKLAKTTSFEATKDIVKKLRVIETFIKSGVKPEHMILTIIPVIPPDLRPLVMLQNGTFANSDLNELYRRLLNRNNRLRRLIETGAPEIIIKNEKRMLQQSADSLFDNSRSRKPTTGSDSRDLKSLADIIKGKEGRFRQNLLGKRVDYSARSVIIVGPELKINQCGLPKRIALELYQPFVIKRLRELGKCDSMKAAKRMIERQDEILWDILEEVIKNHPVLLNRAPTLHRMGIQAFQPILIEGNSIKLHPLSCTGFNADFDGDQMAVHLPLSLEAQIEARTLMMLPENIFSPASGDLIVTPTQDIVLGIFYLTMSKEQEVGEGMNFASPEEAILAYDAGKLGLHAVINVRFPTNPNDPQNRIILSKNGPEIGYPQGAGTNSRFKTTVGRIIFNDILPPKVPFYNYQLNKKSLMQVISECHRIAGNSATIKLLDSIKMLGFKFATLSGLSFSKDDLRIPPDKEDILKDADEKVSVVEKNYHDGILTNSERYSQIIDIWTYAREKVSKSMMEYLRNDTRDGKPYINPVSVMVDSGARGSQDQVRQLAGMRGLMTKPSGQIIETPIKSNFREGLSVLEYFSSTHGARKGTTDTALKTSDAGYLTRKLVDCAQNITITCHDCGTLKGITKSVVYKGDKVEVPLSQSIFGRVARTTLVDVVKDQLIVRENELITREIAKRIEELGIDKIRVRSPLTCEAPRGICALCYGMDLSKGKLVEEGTAVGIIAAQSIGEPGTQLTLRTFHYGGISTKSVEEAQIFSKKQGCVKWTNIKCAEKVAEEHSKIVDNRNAELIITDEKDREIERYELPTGSRIFVQDNQKIKAKTLIAKWDPHNILIVTEVKGKVAYEDMVKNKTFLEEYDRKTGLVKRQIMEHKGELHPQITILDAQGKILESHSIPEKAIIEVKENQEVQAGDILAKIPREQRGLEDITGGLPRCTELFEARRPENPAIISEIDGVVELGKRKQGKTIIVVTNPETGMRREHIVPYGRHLRVRTGDKVKAGDSLVEGPLVLQDILRILGVDAVQNYILKEIQNVYRPQGVNINDKHIEIIISQMLRRVKIENPGNTRFFTGLIVDKMNVNEENQKMKKLGKKPASFKPLLLGITKASIQSESFLSAASFQETARVLTEAAISKKRDHLLGIKENLIASQLIPAGTGYRKFLKSYVEAKEPQFTKLNIKTNPSDHG